ncbi:MAG: NAD(P)-dependent oxidoreductase [Phycisphaerae bacterium]|nr:NAD(P)-dependent oxidoreductase [Phycisphaerae bacterium]
MIAITSKTQIGWVGTGVMGASMCGHLLRKGYPVVVFNRTRAKAESLIGLGAPWVDSPAAAAQQAGIVFTMVGFPEDVREVYFGKKGVLAGVKPGTVLVDMTTTRPSLAREIHAAAAAKGVHALDAPVSGGDVGAREAKLSIMVGGDREVFEALRSVLGIMGPNVVFQGPPGAGQNAKMCNQIVIAGTMIGVCESLLYGFRAGLDLETMLSSIRGGAAACWTLDKLAPRILRRDFEPGFFVEHFVKDMRIALEEAQQMGVSLPGLALVHQLYMAVIAQGYGRKGTHALMRALEGLSNVVL